MWENSRMKRIWSPVSAALILLTCYLLSGCANTGSGSAGLQVTSVSRAQGLQIAEQFCDDLAEMANESALQRMASRTLEIGISNDDVSAIVDYAQSTQCPDQF